MTSNLTQSKQIIPPLEKGILKSQVYPGLSLRSKSEVETEVGSFF